MKKLLIAGNVILAFLLAISLWGAFSGGSDVKLEVGKKKKRTKSVTAAAAPAPAKFKVPGSEEAAATIVRKNVFDTQRTGGAAWGRGATYTLVGIYRVNKTQGAIITSKGGVRQGNMPIKQFFRVGDTLPNGYTLSEINSNQAILMRGASRMTLDLAYSSQGNTTRSTARRNTNPMQQMLNLMQQSIGMQQRQQMNMMRMMQQNNNRSSSTSSRGSTNRRGR